MISDPNPANDGAELNLSKNVLIRVPDSAAEPPKPIVAIPAANAFLSGNQLNKLTIGSA